MTEARVPGITLLIATFELFSSEWVSVGLLRSILTSVVKFTNAMTQELVAGNVDFIRSNCLLSQDFSLIFSGKLHGIESIGWHRVAEHNILEAEALSDIVIVWNIDAERATISCETDDL